MNKLNVLFISAIVLAPIGCAKQTSTTPVVPALTDEQIQAIVLERSSVQSGDSWVEWRDAEREPVLQTEFVAGFGQRNSLMSCGTNDTGVECHQGKPRRR